MNKRKLHYLLSAIALSWTISILRVYINLKTPVAQFESYLPELPQLSFQNMFTYLFQ